MSRVLVTGANGFIGSQLCRTLMERGYEMRAALRQPYLSGDFSVQDIIVVGNIGPATRWKEALYDVNCIIHLAARVHVMAETTVDPLEEFRRVNVDGTMNLARQAAATGVKRFICLSSIKVNGETSQTGRPFKADDSPSPSDSYGVSKFETERALLELAAATGMEVVIIRPPLVYGFGVKANFHKMMQWLVKGVPLPFGAIHNKRSLVALENLVDLIATCIDHPAAANQVFLAGDGEDLSTTELLQRLGRALDTPIRLIPVPQIMLESCLKILAKGDLARRLCGSLQVDISKAQTLLSWIPPIGVDEGFKRTAE